MSAQSDVECQFFVEPIIQSIEFVEETNRQDWKLTYADPDAYELASRYEQIFETYFFHVTHRIRLSQTSAPLGSQIGILGEPTELHIELVDSLDEPSPHDGAAVRYQSDMCRLTSLQSGTDILTLLRKDQSQTALDSELANCISAGVALQYGLAVELFDGAFGGLYEGDVPFIDPRIETILFLATRLAFHPDDWSIYEIVDNFGETTGCDERWDYSSLSHRFRRWIGD